MGAQNHCHGQRMERFSVFGFNVTQIVVTRGGLQTLYSGQSDRLCWFNLTGVLRRPAYKESLYAHSRPFGLTLPFLLICMRSTGSDRV